MMKLKKTSLVQASVLTCTTAMLVVFSGCGGGGGGPKKSGSPTPVPTFLPPGESPTTTPTVTPTPSSVLTPFGTGPFTPNYITDIDAPKKWTRFPLRIAFHQDVEFTQPRKNLTIAGLDQWVTATKKAINYTVVGNESDADIVFSFSTYNNGGILGTTLPSVSPANSNILVHADIEIGFTGLVGVSNLDQATVAHEFGHALGVLGTTNAKAHSSDPGDLMYFAGDETDPGVVTQSDLNTMLTIYGGNFPQNTTARTASRVGAIPLNPVHRQLSK